MPEQTSPHSLGQALGISTESAQRFLPNDRLKLSWLPIDKLHQSPTDPVRYSRKDSQIAEAIIRRFGIRVPFIVDSTGRVISAFVAVIAARRLGYEELPVVFADDLNATEQSALGIALDSFYKLGKRDQQLLGHALVEIETKSIDFGFEGLGLDQAEIDRAIGTLSTQAGSDAELEIKLSARAVSRVGDVWRCGRNRVGCGDTGSEPWLAQLFAGARAAMVFADPPYGCRVGKFVTTRAHREFVEASGELDNERLRERFAAWCQGMRGVCQPGALVYLCIDWRSLQSLMSAATNAVGDLLNILVWVKDRSGMGSFYRSKHEFILLLRVPGKEHRNNVQLGRYGRNRSNVWTYPSAAGFAHSGTEGDLRDDHPTPKNKEMIADAMLDCTKRGDIVFDGFLGGGSTLISAEKVGRICYGSELDPLYVDAAIRRWQDWTGSKAVHAVSGRTFDAIARESEGLIADGEQDNG